MICFDKSIKICRRINILSAPVIELLVSPSKKSWLQPHYSFKAREFRARTQSIYTELVTMTSEWLSFSPHRKDPEIPPSDLRESSVFCQSVTRSLRRCTMRLDRSFPPYILHSHRRSCSIKSKATIPSAPYPLNPFFRLETGHTTGNQVLP